MKTIYIIMQVDAGGPDTLESLKCYTSYQEAIKGMKSHIAEWYRYNEPYSVDNDKAYYNEHPYRIQELELIGE